MKSVYVHSTQWAGYDIHRASTGWVINFWSRVQDSIDGRRILVPYSNIFPISMELNDWWNPWTQNGAALVQMCPLAHTLRRGHVVR